MASKTPQRAKTRQQATAMMISWISCFMMFVLLTEIVGDVVEADVQCIVAELCLACLSVDHTVRPPSVYLRVEQDCKFTFGVDWCLNNHDVLLGWLINCILQTEL